MGGWLTNGFHYQPQRPWRSHIKVEAGGRAEERLRTFCTFTGVLVGAIATLGPILTGSAGAFVNVHLTQITCKTWERKHKQS